MSGKHHPATETSTLVCKQQLVMTKLAVQKKKKNGARKIYTDHQSGMSCFQALSHQSKELKDVFRQFFLSNEMCTTLMETSQAVQCDQYPKSIVPCATII